jgi:hypothetical protein
MALPAPLLRAWARVPLSTRAHTLAAQARRLHTAPRHSVVGVPGPQSSSGSGRAGFWLVAAGTAALVAAGTRRDGRVEAKAASDCREEETDIGFTRTLEVKVRGCKCLVWF